MSARLTALAAVLASSTALQLQPCTARTLAAARPALRARPLVAEEASSEEAATVAASGEAKSRDDLILFDTISDDYKTVRPTRPIRKLSQRGRSRHKTAHCRAR